MPTKKIATTPNDGWGWSDSNDVNRENIPQAFLTEFEQDKEIWSGQAVTTLRGNMIEPQYDLDDFSVLLLPRHGPWDVQVNVAPKSRKNRQLNGFASIDIASFE